MELAKKLSFLCRDRQCEFRTISAEDVSEAYIEGLRKEKKFLENNPKGITKKMQMEYIRKILASENDTICGLLVDSELVGTAGIQNIPGKYGSPTTMGIFVFSKESRGKGYGKTLVWASAFLVNACHGNIFFGAGMQTQNTPSLRSFLSCGFRKASEDEAMIKVGLSSENLTTPEFISRVELIPCK